MGKTYRVEWSVDVHADSAKEAVKQAWEMMQDPESTATYFNIFSEGEQIFDEDYYDAIHEEEKEEEEEEFLIYCEGESKIQEEPMFWSNSQGWVDIDFADRYKTELTSLPVGEGVRIVSLSEAEALLWGDLVDVKCKRCAHEAKLHAHYPESTKCLVPGCGCNDFLE